MHAVDTSYVFAWSKWRLDIGYDTGCMLLHAVDIRCMLLHAVDAGYYMFYVVACSIH